MFASNSSQVSSDAIYVEDVFSTYLYTGNGSTQTITNGVDLSGKGGLVWSKPRNDVGYNIFVDTSRGATKVIASDATFAQLTVTDSVTGFTSTGYTIGAYGNINYSSSYRYVSWTFRKQPKFFDIVTWTGDGTNNRQISHALGSTPGCIIVKELNQTGSWYVYHRSNGTGAYMRLNAVDAVTTAGAYFPAVSSTTFTPTSDTQLNTSSVTYVAYLFAHDAGGFGLTGTDNVISCGSYTGNGSTSGPTVTLGYEPQWILIKRTDTSGQYWCMWDNMRGIVTGGNDPVLYPNVSDAENTGSEYLEVNATGFQLKNTFTAINASGSTYIYIAIRRGPMKTPTTGASVFEPAFATANSPEYKSNTVISGFDSAITIYRPGYSDASFSYPYTAARLTGARQILQTSRANAEYTYSTAANFAYNTGWFDSTFGNDTNRESYMFKRAPGFHDVVCYTGTGVSGQTVKHGLTVEPELMIVKCRSTAPTDWLVYCKYLGALPIRLVLNASAAASAVDHFTAVPTASQFYVNNYQTVGESGQTYVAYLFASCPGVSKVGSYTGTGTTKQVDCGFAAGARFVLIKRTDSTGDWYVWDSARGIVSGNDPYLLLNSTAAEVTSTDYIDTYSAGFEISSTAPAAINASGGTYIFLAIA